MFICVSGAISQQESIDMPKPSDSTAIRAAMPADMPVIIAVKPNFGFEGSRIHIVGKNFNKLPEGNHVYFGGYKAVVESVHFETDSATGSISKMEIIAVVPHGAENCVIKLSVGNFETIAESKFYVYDTELTGSGYIFVFLAFGFVGTVTFYSLYKVLTTKKPAEE